MAAKNRYGVEQKSVAGDKWIAFVGTIQQCDRFIVRATTSDQMSIVEVANGGKLG